MAQESAYVPAPYNGISQSAASVRLLEQAADLQDCLVDLPDGWRKRPPIRWLGEVLSATGLPTAKVHKIVDPDDASLKFLLVNREGAVTVPRLYDAATMALIPLTVSGAAQTYLNTAATPLKSTLRISQAVDNTIITSRHNVIGVDASLVATRPHEALAFVKSGAFGKKYQLLVQKSGGTLRTGVVVTPDGTDASDSFFVATDHIAGAIAGADTYTSANGATHTSIMADLATDGFTVVIKGAVIYLAHTTDFTVSVQDDQGGAAFVVAKDTVNNFSDLPKDGVTDGFTVSVVPTRGDQQGAYYVKFVANPPRGQSPWQETVAPGSQKGFDTTDMPIRVRKDSGGNWQCEAPAWKQRTVGSESLSIDPLFVGDSIEDVGYAFGRLVILSQEECFLTAADDPFRIYPATLTTQIDSDPVSLSPPTGDAKFRSLTTFSSDALEGAFLTGLQQQCILRQPGDGAVTPNNVKLARMCTYVLKDTFTDLRPMENNSKVYLPVPLGSLYSGLRELQVDRISGETLGDDLTAAQPKYLPAGINVAATCQTNYTSMYGVAGTTKIYTHVHRYNGTQRVQNGMFTWNIPSGWTLLDIAAHGTLFYFFLTSDDIGRICAFAVETNPQSLDDDASSTVITKLDMKQSEAEVVSRTYNAGTNRTTIVSQVPLPAGRGYVAARAGSVGGYLEGYLAEVISQPTATSIVIKGDWTGTIKFYLGIGYVGIWEPSTINKYSPQDSRIMHGRLTLGRIHFDLKDSTALSVEVAISTRSTRTYELKQITFGTPSLYTGEWVVPIKGESPHVRIRILDAGHVGAVISGFEWEGDFISKARRTT